MNGRDIDRRLERMADETNHALEEIAAGEGCRAQAPALSELTAEQPGDVSADCEACQEELDKQVFDRDQGSV